jgi:hypothetical protein
VHCLASLGSGGGCATWKSTKTAARANRAEAAADTASKACQGRIVVADSEQAVEGVVR